MRPPRRTSLQTRLILGGTILVAVGALVLWVGALDSGQPRGRHEAPVATTPPPAAPAASERSAALAPTAPEHARHEQDPAPAPAAHDDDGMGARVEDATAQLVRALDVTDFAHSAWQDEAKSRAAGLGKAALPALEAIVADDTRTDEEHIAASELATALRAR